MLGLKISLKQHNHFVAYGGHFYHFRDALDKRVPPQATLISIFLQIQNGHFSFVLDNIKLGLNPGQ